jgi:hypothetical protein
MPTFMDDNVKGTTQNLIHRYGKLCKKIYILKMLTFFEILVITPESMGHSR